MANILLPGRHSENGRSLSERGTETAPFNLPPKPPTNAAQKPPTDIKGDLYPGDPIFNQRLQKLYNGIRGGGLNYSYYDPLVNTQAVAEAFISTDDLIKRMVDNLANRINSTPRSPKTGSDKGKVDMSESGLNWLLNASTANSSLVELRAKIQEAIDQPTGYPSSASAADRKKSTGFGRWQGRHLGYWFSPDAIYHDPALWKEIEDKFDPVTGRTFRLQTVRWPERASRQWGWNLSDRDTPFVWGWDPKDHDPPTDPAAGGIWGTHLGFPFTWKSCDFIFWLSPREVFLEGVNRNLVREKTVNGQLLKGNPKASADLGSGCGQWVIVD